MELFKRFGDITPRPSKTEDKPKAKKKKLLKKKEDKEDK